MREQTRYMGGSCNPFELPRDEAIRYIMNKVIASIPSQLLVPEREGALRDVVMGAAQEITAEYELSKR